MASNKTASPRNRHARDGRRQGEQAPSASIDPDLFNYQLLPAAFCTWILTTSTASREPTLRYGTNSGSHECSSMLSNCGFCIHIPASGWLSLRLCQRNSVNFLRACHASKAALHGAAGQLTPWLVSACRGFQVAEELFRILLTACKMRPKVL